MSLTQGAWSNKTVNGFMVGTCTVVQTASETDAYTLKVPAGYIDGTKPWTLIHSAAATPDGQALPVDIWIGYDDDFALSGQGASVVATNGAMYKQINDDCVLAVTTVEYAYHIHPNLGVADVVTVAAIATGYKVNIPAAPYYAFNLDGGSALAATTTTWVVVQKK
jgi:hypothetical protein